MRDRSHKISTVDTPSGCDLIMMPSSPDEKNLADLPIKSNEAYVRSKDRLFYIDKAEKACIEIKLTSKKLKRFDIEIKPASTATTLTKEQLERIQSITDDAVLEYKLNSAIGAYKDVVNALLNTLPHQQKMAHEQEEVDKKEKEKEIIYNAILLQNNLKTNEIEEMLDAILKKENYILRMMQDYNNNVHLKILLQEQSILEQIEALHKSILEQINKEISKNAERIRELQNSIAAGRMFITSLEKTIKAREERISKEAIRLAELKEEIRIMTDHIVAREKRIAAREERIAAREERIAAREERIAAREKRIAAREKSIAKDEAHIVELEKSISARKARNAAREEENVRDLPKLEKLKEHFLQHKNMAEYKTKNIDTIDQNIRQVEADITHENEELSRLKLDESNIRGILSELHKKHDQIIEVE